MDIRALLSGGGSSNTTDLIVKTIISADKSMLMFMAITKNMARPFDELNETEKLVVSDLASSLNEQHRVIGLLGFEDIIGYITSSRNWDCSKIEEYLGGIIDRISAARGTDGIIKSMVDAGLPYVKTKD